MHIIAKHQLTCVIETSDQMAYWPINSPMMAKQKFNLAFKKNKITPKFEFPGHFWLKDIPKIWYG